VARRRPLSKRFERSLTGRCRAIQVLRCGGGRVLTSQHADGTNIAAAPEGERRHHRRINARVVVAYQRSFGIAATPSLAAQGLPSVQTRVPFHPVEQGFAARGLWAGHGRSSSGRVCWFPRLFRASTFRPLGLSDLTESRSAFNFFFEHGCRLESGSKTPGPQL
jgi:hypothetical protein